MHPCHPSYVGSVNRVTAVQGSLDINGRRHLKSNWRKQGWGHGLNGTAPAGWVQDPGFKLSTTKTKTHPTLNACKCFYLLSNRNDQVGFESSALCYNDTGEIQVNNDGPERVGKNTQSRTQGRGWLHQCQKRGPQCKVWLGCSHSSKSHLPG
jgi:hypothetical protein